MIKLILLFLSISQILCCSNPINDLSDYWEYSPGKWLSFKTDIEIKWDYDGNKIDKFRIDRRKAKLSIKDELAITSLIHRKNVEGLIEKEISLRKRINFNRKKESYQSSSDMNYKDIEGDEPAFGEVRFYQITAMKNFASSLPIDISVIFIDRSK